MNHALFALVATCCALTAQEVAMRDGSDRHVVGVDVAELLRTDAPLAAAPVEGSESARAARLQDIARFVRAFAPVLAEPGADLQTLGDCHLVALGKPEQVAAVERVVVRARENKEAQFHVDLRVLTVPAAIFERELANTLSTPRTAPPTGSGRAPLVAVLGDERATRLLRALRDSKRVDIVQAPNPTAPRLDLVRIRV